MEPVRQTVKEKRGRGELDVVVVVVVDVVVVVVLLFVVRVSNSLPSKEKRWPNSLVCR